MHRLIGLAHIKFLDFSIFKYSVLHRLHRSNGQAAGSTPWVAFTGGDGGAVLCDPCA